MNPNMLIRFTVTPSQGINRKAPKKGERKSGGSPDRKAGRESEEENQEDETQTGNPVPDHEVQTVLEVLGREVPGRRLDAFRKLDSPDDFARPLGGLRKPAAFSEAHGQEYRGFAVHPGFPIRRIQAVGHDPHLSQAGSSATRDRNERDPPEVFSVNRGPFGSQAELVRAAARRSGRNLRGTRPHGSRHPIESQPEARQVLLGDLDRQFPVPPGQALHTGYPANCGDGILDPAGRLVKVPFAGYPVHGDPEDLPVLGDFGYHGILRLGREGGERSHALAHPVPDAADVRPGFQNERQRRGLIHGEAGRFANALNPPERFFQQEQHARFDHFGFGSRQHDPHHDGGGRRLRKEFVRNSAEGDVAGQTDPEEDQVRSDPVPHESGDHSGGTTAASGGGLNHGAASSPTREVPHRPPRALP